MFGRKKKDADKQPKQKTTHNTVQTAQAVSSYYYKRLPVTTLPNKNMRLNNGLVLQELELPIAEFTISTPDGDGWLVFSTLRVYVVIKGKGNHIFLETAMIDEIKQKGNNITIYWSENYTNHYDYTVRVTGDNKIEDVVYLFDKSCVYREAKHVDIPADERNAIRNYRVENQKLKVKALEDELYELRKKLSVMKQEMYDAMDAKKSDTDDDTNKNDSQNNSKNNSKNKPNRQHNQTPFVYITDGSNIRKRIKEIEEIMPMERDNLYFMSFGMVQRHPAIPAHINNKDVWYDTYYDRERDVYFRGIDDDTFNNATKKLRKELKMPYGCGWTPYASKDISFVHGVPAVRSMISSVNACAKEHTYRSLPSLGVENAHWRMFIFKHSIINRDYYSQIDLNSQGYNNIDKIYSLLLLRLGQTQKRYGGTYNSPTDRELVEEDIHLAKEGNKNFNSLVCNDTEYSDGEHISQAATPQMQWKDSWYPVYILKD